MKMNLKISPLTAIRFYFTQEAWCMNSCTGSGVAVRVGSAGGEAIGGWLAGSETGQTPFELLVEFLVEGIMCILAFFNKECAKGIYQSFTNL